MKIRMKAHPTHEPDMSVQTSLGKKKVWLTVKAERGTTPTESVLKTLETLDIKLKAFHNVRGRQAGLLGGEE